MLNDVISKHKGAFASGVHTELRTQLNRSRRVIINGGDLVVNNRNDISGVSARVYKNGVYGFSSMAELSDDAVKAVLRTANENACFMDKHIKKNKPILPPITGGHIALKNNVRDVEQKQYIEYVSLVDKYIANKYPNLVNRSVTANADSMEKLCCTSDGYSCHSDISRSYIYLHLSAETPQGMPVEMFDILGGLGTFDKNFTDTREAFDRVDMLYEKLMRKREGVYPQAGLKTCILGGVLSGMLAHEAVGHTVEADFVLGGSVAANCIGKRVASDLVNLTDFANTALGKTAPLPVFVDDEGTPAEDAVIIKDGILVGYMNSRETAQYFNMKPQGNARAYLFSDEPLIRMRNTAVLPGSSKLEDMIASVEDGYYLVDTNNGQADSTGEFMFGVTMGYEIKNGKLGKAILDTTISGIAFEMLKTVDMVSDGMNWGSSGYCGKKQPMPVAFGGPELRCKVMIGGR